MNTPRRFTAAVAGLGLALSLSACSSESTEEANAAYCEASAAALVEYAQLKTLITSGDATLDQVNEQREVIAEANEEVQSKAENLADSLQDQIREANEAFDDAIDQIPGDSTIPEAANAYNAAVDAWDLAIAGISSEVGCE